MTYILLMYTLMAPAGSLPAGDGRMLSYAAFPGLVQCQAEVIARQCDAKALTPPRSMMCLPGVFPDGADLAAWLAARSIPKTP